MGVRSGLVIPIRLVMHLQMGHNDTPVSGVKVIIVVWCLLRFCFAGCKFPADWCVMLVGFATGCLFVPFQLLTTLWS